jgi:hypothetical protein
MAAPGQDTVVTLRTEAPARLDGRLVGADKQPVAGAEVRLLHVQAAGLVRCLATATSNRRGEFRFAGLPAVRFDVALPPGHRPAREMIELVPGTTHQLGELTVHPR